MNRAKALSVQRIRQLYQQYVTTVILIGLDRRISFYRIKKYIENGGIFLYSAGIPFYYMFDGFGNRIITGQPLEWRTNNGTPFVVRGQTNPLHSWQRKIFGVSSDRFISY